jgi:hypothetical protein
MAKYRAKSGRVDAVQWDGSRMEGPPAWLIAAIQNAGTPDTPGCIMRIGQELHIGSRSGVQVCKPGCWVVRLADGSLFSLPSPAFHDLFEPVV